MFGSAFSYSFFVSPRILSAIFSIRGTEAVLYPPYALNSSNLVDPVITNMVEFEDFVGEKESIKLLVEPAKDNFILWINKDGFINYDLTDWVEGQSKNLNTTLDKYA